MSLGPTTGNGIRNYFDSFKKMKINVDPSIERPINGEQFAKLASDIGIITRDVLLIPKKWKEVDEVIGLKSGFDHLHIHMIVDIDEPNMKQSLVEGKKISTRQNRYKLHQHFLKYTTL
ncbi:hypothetical protein ACS0TY_006505 [Phlomoides rotata]